MNAKETEKPKTKIQRQVEEVGMKAREERLKMQAERRGEDKSWAVDYIEKIGANGIDLPMVYVDVMDEIYTPHYRIAFPYHIGKYPVTQVQYQAVMGENPSNFKGDDLPVECVSWIKAMEFCERLSAMTGKIYTLPTEHQWEFAALGGGKSKYYKYSGSDDIDKVAWHAQNADHKTHPVGTKEPNELGIYDMTGNVWEWCNAWYGSYRYPHVFGPDVASGKLGPDAASEKISRNPSDEIPTFVLGHYLRVLRGGSWNTSRDDSGVIYRLASADRTPRANHGFRVVCLG